MRGEGKRPGAVPQQGREADREEELGRGERIKGEGGGDATHGGKEREEQGGRKTKNKRPRFILLI